MRQKVDPPDVVVAAIASRQHGVISAQQLRRAGIGERGVARRIRTGRLHRLHRGVYALGHRALSREGVWTAAVIACGAGAVLSHRSAAVLWGMLNPRKDLVEVSISSRSGRAKRSGIRLHRLSTLKPDMLTERNRIPVTTPARTVSDLRQVLPDWELRRAIRQAEFHGLHLGPAIESDRTRSDLERDFLCLCRRHRLPAPEVNVKVGRWTVDFLWRRERIAVETDFYGYHRGRVAFQDDRARDLDLRRAGFAVHRFSEEQVNKRPAQVAADLRDALGLAS